MQHTASNGTGVLVQATLSTSVASTRQPDDLRRGESSILACFNVSTTTLIHTKPWASKVAPKAKKSRTGKKAPRHDSPSVGVLALMHAAVRKSTGMSNFVESSTISSILGCRRFRGDGVLPTVKTLRAKNTVLDHTKLKVKRGTLNCERVLRASKNSGSTRFMTGETLSKFE